MAKKKVKPKKTPKVKERKPLFSGSTGEGGKKAALKRGGVTVTRGDREWPTRR